MSAMKTIATTAQWIGEEAAVACEALKHGDSVTVQACLQVITGWASELGYRPAPDEEPGADRPSAI